MPRKKEQQQVRSFTALIRQQRQQRQQRQLPHDVVHRLLEKVGVSLREREVGEHIRRDSGR